MTWLMSQMWMFVGAAALLGLIFGASLRGALLRGKLRRAQVERGVAQTELDQARIEIEGLYAAQRRVSGHNAGDMSAELAARDARVAALGDELSAAKAELDRLKSAAPGADMVGGVALGAAATGPVAAVTHNDTALVAERDDLKSQLGALQGELETLRTELADAQQAAPALTADAPVESEGEDSELDKLRWQADYQQTRIRALEAKFGPLEGNAAPSTIEPVTPAPEPEPASADVDADRETPDEELARLRWRNRYLEGRLAYLEEERSREPETVVPSDNSVSAPVPLVDVETTAPQTEPATEVNEVAPAVAEVTDLPAPETIQNEPAPEPAPVVAEAVDAPAAPVLVETPEVEPAPEGDEAVDGSAAADAEDVAVPVVDEPVSELAADTSATGPEKPDALNTPRGAPDDLTQIDGVGPRIADVLQSLGIYHFDQIATWTPNNVAWIDQYMSFDNRVARENWVEQAKTLAGGPA